MQSLLPSAVALGLVALAALALARSRPSAPDRVEERRQAARALAVALAVQAVHFTEELATGFPERLGALFALPPMPLWLFVAFNAAWLGAWAASVPGLRSARPAAFFAAWFLALAGMGNGVAHPLLAVAADGYFPGLLTSPAIAAAALWLWIRLRDATS